MRTIMRAPSRLTTHFGPKGRRRNFLWDTQEAFCWRWFRLFGNRSWTRLCKDCTLGPATLPPRFPTACRAPSESGSASRPCASACRWRCSTSRSSPVRSRPSSTISTSPSDQLSWIQTGYLMAEVIAIPLTGWLTRAVSLRWMFAAATLRLHSCQPRLRAVRDACPCFIAVRVVQGFCGGMLIPGVFTSVFSMMPEKHRVPATALAGTLAVIAPTIGPAIGGYLTEHYTWHWIFLINLVPGAGCRQRWWRMFRAHRRAGSARNFAASTIAPSAWRPSFSPRSSWCSRRRRNTIGKDCSSMPASASAP